MSAKKERILVSVYRCEVCQHVWIPRNPFDPIDPDALAKNCTACKSPTWNVPRPKAKRRPKE